MRLALEIYLCCNFFIAGVYMSESKHDNISTWGRYGVMLLAMLFGSWAAPIIIIWIAGELFINWSEPWLNIPFYWTYFLKTDYDVMKPEAWKVVDEIYDAAAKNKAFGWRHRMFCCRMLYKKHNRNLPV